MDRTDKTGIYIHIPYCASRCPYCDFHSEASRGCPDSYVDALCSEIVSREGMRRFSGNERLLCDSVYFGGGTPSILTPVQLERILLSVKESFSLSPDSEITLECNPSGKGLERLLTAAASLGVNRISLGMQSSDTRERRLLGRRGDTESVRRALAAARNAGIGNISLDIMIGVPDSTEETLKASLDFAVNEGVPHISAYILKIEEGTYFHRNINKLNIPDEDKTADMYLFMSDYLTKRGYLHYEISNFCLDGRYSRHNMKYWDGTDYLGFGPAAHSAFRGKRFYYPADTAAFIKGASAVYDGTAGDCEERIMLSLRTYKGISLENKTDEFLSKVDMLCRGGLGRTENGRLSLTPQGMLISNTVITELLSVLTEKE